MQCATCREKYESLIANQAFKDLQLFFLCYHKAIQNDSGTTRTIYPLQKENKTDLVAFFFSLICIEWNIKKILRFFNISV